MKGVTVRTHESTGWITSVVCSSSCLFDGLYHILGVDYVYPYDGLHLLYKEYVFSMKVPFPLRLLAATDYCLSLLIGLFVSKARASSRGE